MARFGFGVPLVLLVAPLVAPQSDPRAASFASQAIAARIDWRVSAMKRLMLSLIVGFAVANLSQLAIAQSDTGLQPFGTFQSASGPETVNLANLDVHLDIPIVSKTGVGLPFTYSLRFDSLAWTRAWSGGNNQFWYWRYSGGFQGGLFNTLTNFFGQFPNATPTSQCGNRPTGTYNQFIDEVGTSHPTSRVVTLNTSPNCGYPSTQTVTTNDGSGIVVTFFAPGAGSSYATYPDGHKVYTGTKIDTDGNQITSSTVSNVTTVTDTLSVAAMTLDQSNTLRAVYSYPTASGNATVTVNKAYLSIQSAFACSGVIDVVPSPGSGAYIVTSIMLPDGSSYTFTYEPTPGNPSNTTGRIQSITLPTGGTITYTYPGANDGGDCTNGLPLSMNRQTLDGTWQYRRATNGTTTVTDPSGNHMVYQFSGPQGPNELACTQSGFCYHPSYETNRAVYEGTVSTANLLESVLSCYNNNLTNCLTATVTPPFTQKDVYTTLARMSTSNHVKTTYDSYSNVLSLSRFDFGNTTPTSTDTIAYGSWSGSACVAVGSSINDHPCSNIVTDSTGTVAATYDNYDPQGNLLSSKSLVSGSTYLTKSFTYNAHGTVNVATDVNNTTSTYSYNGVCNGLLPTGVIISGTGVSQSRGMSWDCNGGVQTSATDENGKVTTTNFTNGSTADPFYRPLSVVDPLNNTTGLSYTPTTLESAMNFNGAVSTTDALSTSDGLGRPVFAQKRQGPAASTTTFDSTQTSYGWTTTTPTVAGGYFTTQSMPYSGTAAQPAPTGTKVTTTQYDVLSRPLMVTDGGGGTTSYTYAQNDVLQKVGPTQTFQKQLEYDGLGRLTSVCEITSAPGSGSCGQSNPATGFLTKYTYNGLSKLLSVTQNAQPGAIGGQQTRAYGYDGLSRLTYETNPEWGPGTANYTYDVACGSYLASPGGMTKSVDSANNTTCYGYDGLHRLTDAGYSGPTCRHLRYDNNATPPTGITISNTVARLAEAYTDGCSGSKITDEWFSYDADGRMTDVYESTPHSGSPYYHTTACYWPNRTMEALSGIPGVPAIYYGASNCTNSGNGLNGEGRVTKVTAASGASPASSVTYSASTTTTALAGSLTGVTLGSADSDSFNYDPNSGRQTGETFTVNGNTDTGTLTWNQNGTLGTLGIVDHLPGSLDSQTCNYFYDDLGRLGGKNSNGYSVDCGTIWQQLFSFDPFGNINKSGSSSFLATYSAATNRYTLSGVNVQYDGNGNLKTDNLNTYTWDPNFGNLASVNGIGLIYDALGRMVEKQSGSAYTEILYGPGGKTALLNGQTLTKAFINLPGGGTAIYNSTGLAYYRHSDWLGSSRLTSTAGRAPYSTSAYAPFGEQYAVSGTPDPSFTGQNADTVSSLYDFQYRENSPTQGRWISPDPAGMAAVDPNNPQSWNRYAYVLNSPLSNVDPLGLWCVWEDGTHDGDPNTGGFNPAGCAAQGGHWDAWDTITGIFQDGNGNVTQINYAYNGTNYTCTNADCGAGGTLQQFDQTLQTYWQGPAQGQSLDLYLLSVNLRNTVPGPVPTAFFTRPPGPPGPPSARMTQTQWDAWCDLKTAQVGGFNSDEPHVPEYGVSVYNAQVVTVTKNQTMNPESTSAGTAAQAAGAGLAIVTARGTTSSTCKAAYH